MLLTLREEIVCTLILLFLIFYYCVNKVKDKEMLFLKLACIGLAHILFDMVTVVTVNHRDIVPDIVNRILHMGFYITGMLFGIGFYDYVVRLAARYKYMRLFKNTGYLLLLFFTLLLFFLPMEYVQGNGTSYSYGPLAFVGYAIFLLYCTACFVMLLASRKRLDARVRWSLLPMLAAMYTAVIVQAIVPELLMTGGNVTLICISLFAALDNPDKDFMRQALWDFPTGLKNRNCYNRDLAKYTEQHMGKASPARIGFLVADMNYLKAVNDQHGHAEGDRLISAAAAVLRGQLKSAENIYRLGGDEFAAIYLAPDDRAVAAEMENVTRACAEATGYAVPLSIAMGYASGSIDEHVNAIFQEADEKMYAHKTLIKQEYPELAAVR